MAGHVSPRELLAGGGAIAVLFTALLIGLASILAILLAVAAYVGIVWLWPWDRDQAAVDKNRQRAALREAQANAEAIRALQSQIAVAATREQVGRINGRVTQVLAVIQEDGCLAAAPVFNEHLMVPVRALLTEYVRLSRRGIGTAAPLLQKAETHDLPRVEQAIDFFYEQLHRSHLVDLATLGDLLDVNLESMATTSSRRFTS